MYEQVMATITEVFEKLMDGYKKIVEALEKLVSGFKAYIPEPLD